MKKHLKVFMLPLLLAFCMNKGFTQTSWKGTISTNWSTATNWTAGVPTATLDATIGDANFTGSFQPTISTTSTAKTLTIGGTVAATLTVPRTLTIKGNITINTNGTLVNGSASISLTGNWYNGGTYSTTSDNATVIFNGTAQSLGGAVVTTFRKLTINTGSVLTLASNVNCSGPASLMTVNGTYNPGEPTTYLTSTDNLTVNNNAVLKVTGSTFANNYVIATTTLLNPGAIVEYGSTLINQTISSSFTYSTLRISGAGTVKSLAADLIGLRSTGATSGNILVLSGTMNLGAYLANRSVGTTGGTLSVSNGAFLKIGGTGTFPTGYTTNTLSLSSTVEYNGGNQVVTAKTYGNLLLTSAAGAAVKTMPVTPFTISGSLTSAVGAGTSVSYTAGAAITVTGSVNIGAGTTFDGGSFTHLITGSWNNNGTFIPSTSLVTLRGASTFITGNTTQNFYSLSISGSNITAPLITTINIDGNFSTSGSGTFTQPAPGAFNMTGTATKTFTGSNITLNDFTVSGTATTTATAILTGNINVTGSFVASSGAFTMNGASKTITNSGTLTLRGLLASGTISTTSSFNIAAAFNTTGSFLASAGTITFNSSTALSGTANIFNAAVTGTLTMAANAVMGIAGSFTTTGTFNVTTNIPNTVNYNAAGAQTVKGGTYNNLVLSNGGIKTAAAAITVNKDITIDATSNFTAVTFTHTIVGNWINNGSFTANTSLVQFTGATNSTLNGATTFYNATVNKTLASYTLNLGNNVSVSTINMTKGGINTGANTLTITTTRTGVGVILGTITRTHAFVTGASGYAFESAYNTIAFTAVTGVTSITVKTNVDPVADFPYGGAIGRYYTISVPAGTYTATLRLHYENAELNGNDSTTMQLWRYNGTAWGVSGKTSSSTTNNYVEKTGLTDITNRWTLTDDGSVLNWNGSVSSDWSNGANWTLAHGTYSGAPTSTDVVQIGVTTFTNPPVITTAALAKSILFGSTKAATLTMNTGGSLSVNGSIQGSWSTGAVHTINVNAQTLTCTGDLTLSDNTAGRTINLNISTGTVSVAGAVTQSGSANIVFSGAGTLNIGKDFNYISGSFTPATGLVKYTGAASQVVATVTYNNLTIIKTAGTVGTLASGTTIGGNLTVTSGEFVVSGTVNITGAVLISPNAKLDGNTATFNVSGNWTRSANATFNTGSSIVNMIGTANQTVSAGVFNKFIVNKSAGTVTLSGNDTLNSNLTITQGTLNLSTFTFNQSSAADAFTMANGTTLLVSGAANFPTNFVSYSLGATSTVHYNGAVAQTIADVTYGHLAFSNGTTLEKTFAGSSTINGNITINNTATVNGSSYVITLNGNWSNSGSFVPGTGDILLNGTTKTLTGNTTFYEVTVNGSYSVSTSNMSFNGHFQVTPGGSYAAGSGVATVNGDFTNAGTVTSSGTTTFSGTVLQNIRLVNALISTSTGIVNFNGSVAPIFNSTSTPTFATLNINNTAGISPSVNWVVLAAFNVSSGASFIGGTSTHTFSYNFTNNGTVTSSGTMLFNPSTTAALQLAGTEFSSAGTVIFGGTGLVTMTGTPTALKDVIIANTNAAGITATTVWNMSGNFSINSNAIFNAGSFSHIVAGDIESDGILNGNTSTFTMTSPAGELSGSPGTVFNHLTISGAIKSLSDFNVAGDFMNNGTYDGFIGALIMTGNNAAIIGGTTTPSAIDQLTISKATGITVTSNVNISSIAALIINSGTLFTSTYSLAQNPSGGVIIIANDATLKLGGTNTIPAFSGYGLDTASNVDYAGTTQTIANGPTYGNLLVSAAGTKTALNFLPLTIAGNMLITAGTFVGGNNTHRIAGNWIMTGGTFTNTASTIRFNGSYDQSIQSTGAFNSISINKPGGQVNLSTDVTVNGSLNFTLGKVSTGSNTMVIAAGGIVTGAAQSTGWVQGRLQRNVAAGTTITRNFDLGDNTYYTPASILFTSVGTAGNVLGSVAATDHPLVDYSGLDSTKSVNRSWSFSNSGVVFTDYTGTFNWVASDLDGGATSANFAVGQLTGGSWSLPLVNSPLATSIKATGVTSFGDFAVGEKIGQYKWTGQAFTSDWNTAANWSGGIPTTSLNTIIPTGIIGGRLYPVLTTGTGTVSNITIQSAASLTVSGTGLLQVSGTIVNTGSINLTAGKLELNGVSAQTIPSSGFVQKGIKDLVINNNVTLGDTLNLTGTLTFAASGKTLTTGDFLVLKSTGSATAMIAPMPVNGSGFATSYISGKVMVERYVPGHRSWRLITAPLSNTGNIYQSWQNSGVYTIGKGTFITAPSPAPANGIDSSATNTVSMKTYNVSTQAFINISNTKTSQLSNNTGSADNTGYFMFIRGDRKPANLNPNSTNAATLSGTGYLQTGKQVFPASSGLNKFTIMGNPYAAPVDLNNIQRTRIMKRFWVWDPYLNQVGGYVVLDDLDGDGIFSKSVPGSAQDKNIQSGQAFFVITDTAGAANITYYESSKSSVINNSAFRPMPRKRSLDATLNLAEADGSKVLADAVLAEFDDQYDAQVSMQDAVKFGNINETFSLLRNGTALAIERRPLKGGDTLYFKLTKTSARNYQLVIRLKDMAAPGIIAMLEDKFAGTTTPLNMDGSSTIDFNVSSDPASANDRFRVVFTEAHTLPLTFTGIRAKQKDDRTNVSWTVEQEATIKKYEVEKSLDGRNFTTVQSQPATNSGSYNWTDMTITSGAQYYRIKSIDVDGTMTYSEVVKLTGKAGTSLISVYPNPVTGTNISLQMKNIAKGVYTIRLLNSAGEVTATKTIKYDGIASIIGFEQKALQAAGKYDLQFSGAGLVLHTALIKQ